MGMLLLWCAASIIVPIIRAEGIVAVFFPYLVRSPQVLSSSPCLQAEFDSFKGPVPPSVRGWYEICGCVRDRICCAIWQMIEPCCTEHLQFKG